MSYSTANEFLTVYPKLNGLGQDLIGAFLARGAAGVLYINTDGGTTWVKVGAQ